MIIQAYFSLNNSLFQISHIRYMYFFLDVNVYFPIFLKFKFYGIIIAPNFQSSKVELS